MLAWRAFMEAPPESQPSFTTVTTPARHHAASSSPAADQRRRRREDTETAGDDTTPHRHARLPTNDDGAARTLRRLAATPHYASRSGCRTSDNGVATKLLKPGHRTDNDVEAPALHAKPASRMTTSLLRRPSRRCQDETATTP